MRASTIVGRSPDCHVSIDRPGISMQHASIRWTSRGWILRDLQSRNGTLHNGSRLLPPETRILAVGDSLAFGERDEEWVVVDADPPGLVLLPPPGSGAEPLRITIADGMCALPSADDPQGTVIHDGGSRWVLEDAAGQRRALMDGDVLDIAGCTWTVLLSPADEETADAEQPILERRLELARFAFRVSPDEETASTVVSLAGREVELRASTSLYLLVFLARQRLDPDNPDGWVRTRHACHELRCTPEALNVDVHRARRAVQSLGVVDAANVIERRRGILRFGMPRSNFSIR